MVGLIRLYAAQTLEPDLLNAMPAFKRRLDWFIAHRPDLTENMACMRRKGSGERRLLSITTRTQLEKILKIMLDEDEFLSDYGIRALSRRHHDRPYSLTLEGKEHSVHFGRSASGEGPVPSRRTGGVFSRHRRTILPGDEDGSLQGTGPHGLSSQPRP
jgi:hypothetical protein